MKRSQRLQPVHELANETERGCALRVASVQKRLVDAQRRHAELERYLKEYQQTFQGRASTGIGVSGMRDYQIFIARLTEAARQQQQVVQQLGQECEQALARWREAAARKTAVGTVIARAQAEDRRIEDRRAQNELDDRAQRQMGSHSMAAAIKASLGAVCGQSGAGSSAAAGAAAGAGGSAVAGEDSGGVGPSTAGGTGSGSGFSNALMAHMNDAADSNAAAAGGQSSTGGAGVRDGGGTGGAGGKPGTVTIVAAGAPAPANTAAAADAGANASTPVSTDVQADSSTDADSGTDTDREAYDADAAPDAVNGSGHTGSAHAPGRKASTSTRAAATPQDMTLLASMSGPSAVTAGGAATAAAATVGLSAVSGDAVRPAPAGTGFVASTATSSAGVADPAAGVALPADDEMATDAVGNLPNKPMDPALTPSGANRSGSGGADGAAGNAARPAATSDPASVAAPAAGASGTAAAAAAPESIQDMLRTLAASMPGTQGTGTDPRAATAGLPKLVAAAAQVAATDSSYTQAALPAPSSTAGNADAATGIERSVQTPVSDRTWPQAVAAQVLMLATHEIQSATLRLSPEHLGPVEVQIDLQQSQVNVTFGAAHPETRAALEQAIPNLRSLFAGSGLTLGQASVQQQSQPGGKTSPPARRRGLSTAAVQTVTQATQSAAPVALGLVDEYV